MRTDSEFEEYLRRFRPRRPRPLPARRVHPLLGVAAMIALAFTLWTTARPHSHTEAPRPVPLARVDRPAATLSLCSLRALAMRDPETLERALDAESRRTLPDVKRGQGVLALLARASADEETSHSRRMIR